MLNLSPFNKTQPITKEYVYSKFSAVVPAYNEDGRFQKVLNELVKVPHLDEIVFVNDGSSDKTDISIQAFIEKYPNFIKYIKHTKNKGKGAALSRGVKESKNEVILFLDSDLKNITSDKIFKIVEPVLLDEVDMSRGTFSRKRGRVTEFAVKPMMEILFPSIHFEQPISGQICTKKDFLINAEFVGRYGVDIGLLFEAIESGLRIQEVNIGYLSNRENPEETIREMSRQVLETMISRAGLIRHKYKLVLFTLDNTLIYDRSFSRLFEKFGIDQKINQNTQEWSEGKIDAQTLIQKNAALFKGIKVKEFKSSCNKLPRVRYSREVINALTKRKYKVGIISCNFSPIVESFAKRLRVDFWDGIRLEEKKGKYTGKIVPSSNSWINPSFDEGFVKSFQKAAKSQKVKFSETVMVAGNTKSIGAFNLAGISIAYKSKDKDLRQIVDKNIKVLAEILAIIE